MRVYMRPMWYAAHTSSHTFISSSFCQRAHSTKFCSCFLSVCTYAIYVYLCIGITFIHIHTDILLLVVDAVGAVAFYKYIYICTYTAFYFVLPRHFCVCTVRGRGRVHNLLWLMHCCQAGVTGSEYKKTPPLYFRLIIIGRMVMVCKITIY